MKRSQICGVACGECNHLFEEGQIVYSARAFGTRSKLRSGDLAIICGKCVRRPGITFVVIGKFVFIMDYTDLPADEVLQDCLFDKSRRYAVPFEEIV